MNICAKNNWMITLNPGLIEIDGYTIIFRNSFISREIECSSEENARNLFNALKKLFDTDKTYEIIYDPKKETHVVHREEIIT